MSFVIDMNLSPRWVQAIAASVIAALGPMADELAAGALLSIEPQRTRMRLLPLRKP